MLEISEETRLTWKHFVRNTAKLLIVLSIVSAISAGTFFVSLFVMTYFGVGEDAVIAALLIAVALFGGVYSLWSHSRSMARLDMIREASRETNIINRLRDWKD